MPTYLDYGFDKYLQRSSEQSTGNAEVDPLQFEQFTQDVPGDKMFSGIARSTSQTLALDLQNDLLNFSTNAVDQIRIGRKANNELGYEFRDINNSLLMDSEGFYPASLVSNVYSKTINDLSLGATISQSVFAPINELTINFTLTIPSFVIALLFIVDNGSSVSATWKLRIDGIDQTRSISTISALTAPLNQTLPDMRTLGVGDHRYQAIAKNNNPAGGTPIVNYGSLEIIIFGR